MTHWSLCLPHRAEACSAAEACLQRPRPFLVPDRPAALFPPSRITRPQRDSQRIAEYLYGVSLRTLAAAFPSLEELVAPGARIDARDEGTARRSRAGGGGGGARAPPPPATLPRLRRLCVGKCSSPLSTLAPALTAVDARTWDVGLGDIDHREPSGATDLSVGFKLDPFAPEPTFALLPSPASFPALSRLRLLSSSGRGALRVLRDAQRLAGGLTELEVEWWGAPAPLAAELRGVLPWATRLERLRVTLRPAEPPLREPMEDGAELSACFTPWGRRRYAGPRGWDDAGLAAFATDLVRPPSLRAVAVSLPPGSVLDPAAGGSGSAHRGAAFWAGCVALMAAHPWLQIEDRGAAARAGVHGPGRTAPTTVCGDGAKRRRPCCNRCWCMRLQPAVTHTALQVAAPAPMQRF
jgi:hypothetical protein